jgi:MinD-like ATPase involved in chromosome partitioning or flagellar assembly
MSEPEIALVFTAEPWVEELHRHLTDHGGARVRSLVVEQSIALEESYDVLVVSHRWPALTLAFVADVHARGRRVLGVHDLAEPASRAHLAAVEVDDAIESDAGPDAFVRALIALGSQRGPVARVGPVALTPRAGRLVVVGGPPGVGRTEIAIQLAVTSGRGSRVALVDCDDVAPAIAQRLALALEPNLRTAIDAVEHGRGDLVSSVLTDPRTHVAVVGGIPSSAGWAQVRPGEVIRVIDRLGDEFETIVADGAGCLQELGGPPRGRFATAQALVREADALVAVCDASPVGVARLLAWTVDARLLAPTTPLVVVTNRAPNAAFRRGELYDEITASCPVANVVFVGVDQRVVDAAWAGDPVARGRFTRSVERLRDVVDGLPRRAADEHLDIAS